MSESNSRAAVLEAPVPPCQTLAPAPPVRASFLGRLLHSVTALTIFAALAGLLVWGHHPGWKFPSFSSLMGKASEGKDDWCAAHGVPESECVECNPDLMPRLKRYGWCKRHGIHDCPLDHPDVAQTPISPHVTAEDLARAQRALDFAERPENNSKCKSHERRIQFASQEAVEKAGVEVEPVWKTPVVEFVTGNGEITYDQTRTARLSARVPGAVVRALKQVGDRVREGEMVALVDAADVGRAKSEFLHALVENHWKKTVLENSKAAGIGISVSRQSYQAAEAAFSESRIRLATAQQALTNLGLPVQLSTFDKVPEEEVVPPDGPDRHLCAARLDGFFDDADAGPRQSLAAEKDGGAGAIIDAGGSPHPRSDPAVVYAPQAACHRVRPVRPRGRLRHDRPQPRLRVCAPAVRGGHRRQRRPAGRHRPGRVGPGQHADGESHPPGVPRRSGACLESDRDR